jgi:hypothetical protein
VARRGSRMACAAGAARRNARDYALGPQKKLRKSSSGLRFFSSSSFQPCLRSARVGRVVAGYAPASARAASSRTLTRGAGRRRPTRTGRSPCPHWPRTRKTHPPALRAERRGCDKSGQRRRRGSQSEVLLAAARRAGRAPHGRGTAPRSTHVLVLDTLVGRRAILGCRPKGKRVRALLNLLVVAHLRRRCTVVLRNGGRGKRTQRRKGTSGGDYNTIKDTKHKHTWLRR